MTENNKTEIIYEEIQLPEVVYEGSDNKLLELVSKLKRGTFRIIVFTIVGLILGWFSYMYYSDTFIVTKIILAVPYKISEAIYVSVIGTSNVAAQTVSSSLGLTEFFPGSIIATFLAERITPVLVGGAIYGCLGYFTGDKRVFTLQRFVKFVCVHVVMITVFVAVVYGVNAKAVYDNNHLKDVQNFFLTSKQYSEAVFDERADILKEAFERGLKKDDTIQHDTAAELPIEIIFADQTRYMQAKVNVDKHYLVTEDGSTYQVSEEFCGYVKEYYDTGSLMGVQNIMVEEEGAEDETNAD